jgi:hypothetical protein
LKELARIVMEEEEKAWTEVMNWKLREERQKMELHLTRERA